MVMMSNRNLLQSWFSQLPCLINIKWIVWRTSRASSLV